MSAKTEQVVLKSIANPPSWSSWQHITNIMHHANRSYYTVRKYLNRLKESGLVECMDSAPEHVEEWWQLTDAGKAHMQEGSK